MSGGVLTCSKALALGASVVCLGRVPRWGLGAYGAPGVQRILEIMQAETVATAPKPLPYRQRSSKNPDCTVDWSCKAINA